MRPGIAAAALLALALVLVLLLMPPPGRPIHTIQRYECLSNVKGLTRALLAYAADADDRFPPADRWTDHAIDRMAARNPAARSIRCPKLPRGEFGYALNDSLAGAPIPDHAATTPLVFESVIGTPNAAVTLARLPFPGRHAGRSNIGYADGSVKSVPITKAVR